MGIWELYHHSPYWMYSIILLSTYMHVHLKWDKITEIRWSCWEQYKQNLCQLLWCESLHSFKASDQVQPYPGKYIICTFRFHCCLQFHLKQACNSILHSAKHLKPNTWSGALLNTHCKIEALVTIKILESPTVNWGICGQISSER